MKHFKFASLIMGLMFLFNPIAVQSLEIGMPVPLSLNKHIITHHTTSLSQVLDPAHSASSPALEIAAVYWLPDFLGHNLGLNNRLNEDKDDNGITKRCENYHNMSATCAAPKKADAYLIVAAGLKCYKNCRCPAKFQYNAENCKTSEGKMVSGLACEGKFEACVCQKTLTVGAGEKCDLFCGGNCVKKSCKTTVTPGSGEQCLERCATGGACTAKSCKAAQTVYSGEQCTEHCASNSSVCTAKGCKSGVSISTGEQCNERCASNSSVCTAKGCKASVSVPSGYQCNERCASNTSICTARGCASTSGYRSCSCGGYGGSVYSCGSTYYSSCSPCCSDTCSTGALSVSCNSNQDKVVVATTGCGSYCYKCQAKCIPYANEKNCSYGTSYCSDGCGGSRLCCKSNPDCNVSSKSCRYSCKTTNSCGRCTACNICPSIVRRNPAQPDDIGWITSDCLALSYKPATGIMEVKDSLCNGTGWHVPSSTELNRFGSYHNEYVWLSDGGCPSGQYKSRLISASGVITDNCSTPIPDGVPGQMKHLRCVKQFTPDNS